MSDDQRPLTVLHTVRSLAMNGITSVVLRTVEQLSANGVRSHVCAIHDDARMAPAFRALGVEPVILGHGGVASTGRTVARLTRLLDERQIDVIHTNQTIDLFVAGLAARARRIPLVATIHWLAEPDTSVMGAGPRGAGRAKQYLRLLADRTLAHRIIAVSAAVRDTHSALLGSGFPASRVQVIFPGISMAEPDEASAREDRRRIRRELAIPDDAPVLLNVGRLHSVKGQRHLVPMMRSLRGRLPGLRLLIAGDGALREKLQASIAAHDVSDTVHLLGARLDVAELMRASDALVLASDSEAAPLPLMEAMRASKPVIATRVGGVPEMVEDGTTGLLVPAGDSEALANAVIQMFTPPSRAHAMGVAGRRLAEERFDIAHVTAHVEALYRELVDRPLLADPAPPHVASGA